MAAVAPLPLPLPLRAPVAPLSRTSPRYRHAPATSPSSPVISSLIPPRPPATNGDKKPSDAPAKTDDPANAEPGQPLAPPPKPTENGDGYFQGNLSLEPNPFEQSFGTGGTVETPGGTKLPSVAALTSPSSLLPGGTGGTPFNWGGGSLRTGPLSPAMLSGPTGDYFGDTTHTLRGGFTPNESSLRTGLTPGGSGSMFPAPSPNSQALYAQLQNGGATPGTLDFHRTAMNAAAAKAREQSQVPTTSAPASEAMTNSSAVKSEPKAAFDPHDNDAANGLFMLAQGAQQRGEAQPATQQFPVGGNQPGHAQAAPAGQANSSPPMNGNRASSTARGVSEAASAVSEDMEPSKPAARGKGKRGSSSGAPSVNGRRKAEDPPARPPANKKARTASSLDGEGDGEDYHSDEDDDEDAKDENGKPKSKMTDEEKRKNFLERNRYVVTTAPTQAKILTWVIVWLLSSAVNARSSGSPTSKTKWKCLAARTTPSRRRFRSLGKRWSTSRRSSWRTKTALSRSSRASTVLSCSRPWRRTTRR